MYVYHILCLRNLDEVLQMISFVRPHLVYGEIIYDIHTYTYNSSFYENIESIQFNAVLAFTGAITETSKERIYQELGFQSLQRRS